MLMAEAPTTPQTTSDTRPALVMLCNAQTPYRLALHLRISREIPGLRLISAFTHEVSNSPWAIQSPAEIGPLCFGQGESSDIDVRDSLAEWRKGAKIIEYLRNLGPAVVVVHGYNDLGRLRVLRWCHANGLPIFLWGDSNALSDQSRFFKRFIKKIYVRYVLSKVLGTMVCGRLGRQFFVNFGADPAKLFLVPYEPDYLQIESLPAETISRTAQQFDLQPDRRRIVYSGRLVRLKRVDLLINAFARIAAERPNWDLVIVGDGPERQSLQALVPNHLKSRVKWLGFLKDQALVSAVYRSSDLLCVPSEYEPWALVVNEATAAGMAVVASDVVGAAAELVRDDVNGKTFPSKDLDALTTALSHVSHPNHIDRLKSESRKVLAEWRQRGDPINGLKQALLQTDKL